jgi:hypothetical protein
MAGGIHRTLLAHPIHPAGKKEREEKSASLRGAEMTEEKT